MQPSEREELFVACLDITVDRFGLIQEEIFYFLICNLGLRLRTLL